MGGRDGESGRERRWWIMVPCWWVIFSACEGGGMAFLVERMGCELVGVLVRGTAAAVFSFEGIGAIGSTEVRLMSDLLELRQLL